MPRAAVVERPDEQPPVERQPGQFARNHQGAPWVAHPTETTKHTGNKADLIVECSRRGIEVPAKVTVAQLHALLGERPCKVVYGRPSSLGKQIENTTNLQKWSERAEALGLYLDLDLLAPLADLPLEQLTLDDPDARDLLDEIAVKAKNRAQAGLAAERGTHGHELTEDHDTEADYIERITRGEDLGLPADVQHALVGAWAQTLDTFGFEILAVEATVVDDHWRQAGTLDRIVRLTRPLRFVTALGEIVELPAGWVGICDIKTGRLRLDGNGFVSYWQSYAVQCASYAQSVPYDPDTDTRGEWGFEIDQRWAIIAHLDIGSALDGEATCRLVLVDLEAGRHAGALCVAAREWERRNDVFSLVTGDLAVTVPVEQDAASGISAATAQPATGAAAPVATTESAPGDGGHRRRALLDRYEALDDDDKRRFCARNDHPDDLDAVERLLDRIEATAAHNPADTPGTAADRLPAPSSPDEGGPADPASVKALRERFATLPDEAQTWVNSLVAAGKAAGVSWSPGAAATVRRFELGRAVMAIASTDLNGQAEDVTRGLLGEATGREEVEQEALPLGAAIGSLGAAEAIRFAQFVNDYLAT
jgi:hypothetical protein